MTKTEDTQAKHQLGLTLKFVMQKIIRFDSVKVNLCLKMMLLEIYLLVLQS